MTAPAAGHGSTGRGTRTSTGPHTCTGRTGAPGTPVTQGITGAPGTPDTPGTPDRLHRRRWLTARMRLTLTYALFVLAAGLCTLSVVYLIMRYGRPAIRPDREPA